MLNFYIAIEKILQLLTQKFFYKNQLEYTTNADVSY